MKTKKIIIIFESYHHKNTEKIALLISQSLQAELFRTKDINIPTLSDFDVIGIGTGIYNGRPHEKIIELLNKMPLFNNKKSFLFTTSGVLRENYVKHISDRMTQKGLKLIGSFSCKGYDSFGLSGIIGGINKTHPDLEDFYNAEIFAKGLTNKV